MILNRQELEAEISKRLAALDALPAPTSYVEGLPALHEYLFLSSILLDFLRNPIK